MQSKVVKQVPPLRQQFTQTYVRPIRFAFIINRIIDYKVLQLVYQYNSALWGGRFNLFVPTDGTTISKDWWSILIDHKPDTIFFVGDINEELAVKLAEELQPFQAFKWDESSLDIYEDEKDKISPVIVSSILYQIRDENRRGYSGEDVAKYAIVGEGQFQKALDLFCGSYLQTSKIYTSFMTILQAKQIICQPDNLLEYLNLLVELRNKVRPITLTEYELGISFHQFGARRATIILTNGLIDDYFLYHVLRWSEITSDGNETVVIVPVECLSSSQNIQHLADWVSSKIGGNTLQFASFSIDLEELKRFREEFKKYLPETDMRYIDIRCCNFYPPVPSTTNLSRQQVINVEDRLLTFEITSPTFAEWISGDRFWVIDLDLSPGLGNKQGFIPSNFRNLNFALSKATKDFWPYLVNMGFRIRTSGNYVSFRSSRSNNYGLFELPTDQEVITALCESFEVNIKGSNDAYYRGIVNLLGTLASAKLLRNEPTVEVFRDRRFIQGGAFTYDEICDLVPIREADRSEFSEVLQRLSGMKLLLRGYTLKCPICGMKAWYNISSVKEQTLCRGCQSLFQIPVKCHFSYRLNKLFREGNNQGALTNILTVSLLYDTAHHSLIWQTETKIETDDTELKPEIDLIAMCDGFLLVGECKNRFVTNDDKKLEKLINQLKRDISVARKLQARLFLFATLQTDIPQKILDLIQDENKKDPALHVRLISRKELLMGQFMFDDDPRQTKLSIQQIIKGYLFPNHDVDDSCYEKDDTSKHVRRFS